MRKKRAIRKRSGMRDGDETPVVRKASARAHGRKRNAAGSVDPLSVRIPKRCAEVAAEMCPLLRSECLGG